MEDWYGGTDRAGISLNGSLLFFGFGLVGVDEEEERCSRCRVCLGAVDAERQMDGLMGGWEARGARFEGRERNISHVNLGSECGGSRVAGWRACEPTDYAGSSESWECVEKRRREDGLFYVKKGDNVGGLKGWNL